MNVRIRPVEDADLDVFFEHQRDGESVRLAGVPPREREAFDAHWVRIRANADSVLRTIEADDQVVGNLLSWEHEGERLVGYWLGREFWGRGIASRALELFLDELPDRPLHATISSHNLASRRVLEKSGFVHEASPEEGVELLRLD